MPAKLFVVPGSQPSRAVKWYLKLAGIGEDRVVIEPLTFEEFLGEKMTKCNPLYLMMPALHLEDGTILTESGAILTYLAGEFGNNKYVPQSGLAKYKLVEALLHHDTLGRNVSRLNMFPVVQGGMMKRPLADSKALIDSNCDEFNYHMGVLEKVLQANDYVAGSEMTIADLLVQCELNQLPLAKEVGILSEKFDLKKFPSIVKYMERMSQVDGHEETLAEAKMLVGFASTDPAAAANA